jgi:uncharacterized protein (TIGR00251 family)
MLSKYKEKLNKAGELYIKIKVRSSASETKFKKILSNENKEILKIDIASPPEKGRANQELIRFLAEEFAVLIKNVKIVSGLNSKLKIIKITDNP